MTKRDEAIQAGARALHAVEDSWNDIDWEYLDASVQSLFRLQSTAALDAHLKVIAEPDAEMVEAGARAIPDEIEIFRALRSAGRSDREKMAAVNALLEPVREAFAMIRKLMGGGE